MSKVLETDITSSIRDERNLNPIALAIAEMNAQLGYASSLIRHGRKDSESFRRCQQLYQKAYDTLVYLGGDRTNFPKKIR